MTGTVKLAVRRKWNILLRTAYGTKSRWLHHRRGLTLKAVRSALGCQPILFYINVRAVGFAMHTARRSHTLPHWKLMFGSVVAWRTLGGSTTAGQSSLIRWYRKLMQRHDVPGYSSDMWSRVAQDKIFVEKRLIKLLAKSEYDENPERLRCGQVHLKSGPPTKEGTTDVGLQTPNSENDADPTPGRHFKCPCYCSKTYKTENSLRKHLAEDHPLLERTWVCSCGFLPQSADAAETHAIMCAKMGTVRACYDTRRVWRVRRDGTLMQTNEAATWLLAEGDEAVRREEDEWKSKMQDADMVRRAIEELRCSEQVTELTHAETEPTMSQPPHPNSTRTHRSNRPEVMKVWTDGACINNGTPEAMAGWGVYFREDDDRNRHEPLQGVIQTNQRAELRAAIYVLEYFDRELDPPPIGKHRTLATDSMYVIKGSKAVRRWARQGWRTDKGKPVSNVDLWKRMAVAQALQQGLVKLEHVKGHSGDAGNDGADREAVWGAYGVDMGPDLNGEEETEEMKLAKEAERKRRDALEEKKRIQHEQDEADATKALVSAQQHAESLEREKINKILDGVDKLTKYCRERDAARNAGGLEPEYPKLHKCRRCGWPGHAKPAVGVCPLHKHYKGQIPRCHYRTAQAKEWILQRQRWRRDQRAAEAARRPWKCSRCVKAFRTKDRWRCHQKTCIRLEREGQRCGTVGCGFRTLTQEGMEAHHQICRFRRQCPYCGSRYENATIENGRFKVTKPGRRMRHAAFASHMKWSTNENNMSRGRCEASGCERVIAIPACMSTSYVDKDRGARETRAWQRARGVLCSVHRRVRDETRRREMQDSAEARENRLIQHNDEPRVAQTAGNGTPPSPPRPQTPAHEPNDTEDDSSPMDWESSREREEHSSNDGDGAKSDAWEGSTEHSTSTADMDDDTDTTTTPT